MVTKDQVTELYIAMFQRAPSQSEIDYWKTSANENGYDVTTLADTMVGAAKDAVESLGLQDLYPQYGNFDMSNPDSVKEVIGSVYSTILAKDPTTDQDGVNYWTNEVLSGKSVGQVITEIENSAKDIAANPDKYKDQFDADTLQKAIDATHAFEAKVEASKQIAANIDNVKVDADSLSEMQNLIKNVKTTDDIQGALDNLAQVKDKIADTSEVDTSVDTQTNTTDENSYEDIIAKMNSELVQAGVDLSKLQTAEGTIKTQVTELDNDQQVKLDSDLNNFVVTYDSEDGNIDLQEYFEVEEGVYNSYGIDAHTANIDSGVYSINDNGDLVLG